MPLSPALCVLLPTCNHVPAAYIPHGEMAGSGHSHSLIWIINIHCCIINISVNAYHLGCYKSPCHIVLSGHSIKHALLSLLLVTSNGLMTLDHFLMITDQ